MRALVSYGLAGVIVVGAAAWLATGTLVTGGNGPGNGHRPLLSVIEGDDHGPIATSLGEAGLLAEHHGEAGFDPAMTVAQRVAQTSGDSAPLQSVRTQIFMAEPVPIEVTIRGRTRAKATVSAVAETAGIVDAVHVTKGQSVEIGDALCTLDQGTRAAAVAQAEAAVAQAQAAVSQAQLDFDTNADLRQRGLAAANTANTFEVQLEAARAQLSSATAQLGNAQAELDRTEIVAKVAGIVQDPITDVGAMLQMGGPCATIVQLDPLVFAGMIPEARIEYARLGLEAEITTVTGQSVPGRVTFISATADAATRAFPAEIEIANADGTIRDGMTASARVSVGTTPGHLLPQSVLTLDDTGVLGVRTVENGVVAFHAIQIISDTRDGVWVTGLPLRAEVITVGQEFVTSGQSVNATTTNADADGEPAEASV